MNKELDSLIMRFADGDNKKMPFEPRFEQAQSEEKFDFMKLVPNLGQDELFVAHRVDPDRDDPPPYVPEGGANCWSFGSCKAYGLITMKCTVMRIIMRFIYELICGMVNIFGLVLIGLCACVPEKGT